MNALDGKAIVVTGAGGGLGAAYARQLAALGAAVVVNDVNPIAAESVVTEIVAAGGRAVAAPGDISIWSFAETLVDAAMDAFGTLTGFVNNAGILRHATIDHIVEGDLRRMLEINLIGTAACAQAATRQLRRLGKGGSILNVASGSQAGDVALGGYGASKAAVASLTYSWAMELRGTGIRMNALSPLATTAMSRQNTQFAALQAQNRDVHYAELPPPEVNAPVVAFLMSDAASEINGQVVRIAGRLLSYVTHPLIAAPVLEDDWTYEKVAAAFGSTLGARQQKLGLAFAENAN
jgi:NAD(P)-dependent dehydrogenase (short-subunit alcohol dehydrogenase family)